MDLEIRHLRAVTAIADAGSLHKAARVLGVAQPTLTAQLRRIEESLGGALFLRLPDGCRPTLLGHQLLARARSVLADITHLTAEMRAAASSARTPQLRIGSTPTSVLPLWTQRLGDRYPEAQLTAQADVSSNTLLRMVAAGQLDVAFVHEMEGTHLRVPEGLRLLVFLEREPAFLSISERHPAACQQTVPLQELADEQWMMDKAADGEWEILYRTLLAAGLTPRVLHGDYSTNRLLVTAGQAVTLCQATSPGADGVVPRRLEGDPIGYRWLLAARSDAQLVCVHDDLRAAYQEAAEQAPLYQAMGPLAFGPAPSATP
ncbi:LysR family transcriptional regulator [Streptomyces sp. BG9H]|uniref:LysR family transcriptional regulator n=1 Tax=Streptomyces anatolicus TaxID=2675858 RepID=A0ABS6YHL2_9ACTN|nr:LysR family transcriptional regulator [Streptomyces anatolicus]MBW5420087.1 LysR family transcriptional regulator [Streptomyces anatolicus]